MTYTLNLTSERLSATIILKVSPGSHRVLLSLPLIRSALCTLIQRQWHQQPGRLISSSGIKACGAASEEPLTLSSCRSSTRLSLCSAHLPPLLKKPARPGHRRARGPDQEAEGNTAQLPIATCWAAERKQPRWRTEPGRPSQRPSILWGIWVRAADVTIFSVLLMIEVSLCEEVTLINRPGGALTDRTVICLLPLMLDSSTEEEMFK